MAVVDLLNTPVLCWICDHCGWEIPIAVGGAHAEPEADRRAEQTKAAAEHQDGCGSLVRVRPSRRFPLVFRVNGSVRR